jgi:hypothetical protein
MGKPIAAAYKAVAVADASDPKPEIKEHLKQILSAIGACFLCYQLHNAYHKRKGPTAAAPIEIEQPARRQRRAATAQSAATSWESPEWNADGGGSFSAARPAIQTC